MQPNELLTSTHECDQNLPFSDSGTFFCGEVLSKQYKGMSHFPPFILPVKQTKAKT